MSNQLVKSLIERLAQKGVKVIKVDDETDCTDAALWITEKIHIQVGAYGIAVVREDNEGFSFYDCTNRIDSIILTLRKAMDDGSKR